MSNQFAVGDVVQLKSGGPEMTVSDTDVMQGQIQCQWFVETKLQVGVFRPESLVKVEQSHE